MSAAQDALLCVFCRRHPIVSEWRPFCSERCKVQDLARWADAAYRVAGEPVTDSLVDDRHHDDPHASAPKSSD
jgi:endogenous inhibitor of DNA gyrase (YacG/DUF329 family)